MARAAANINAQRKPRTRKPGTKAATAIMIKASITRVKSPKVRTFIGRVKSSRTGRITAFTMANKIAVIKAAPNPVTCTPGKI